MVIPTKQSQLKPPREQEEAEMQAPVEPEFEQLELFGEEEE